VNKKQALVGLVVAGMAAFAVEGGEYGTLDLLRLKSQVRREQASIVRLRFEKALTTDPATEEKVAREVYGMIRPGEILYQVVAPDSARRP